MRKALALTALLFAAPLAAQQDDAAGIQAVIGSQLRAFNDRDIAEAWTYASPMIQGLFGDPGSFAAMVERGYPMVWSNSDAEFLDLREIDGRLWQRVMIRDAQGRPHWLDYQMVRAGDGWEINGVRILDAPDVGV